MGDRPPEVTEVLEASGWRPGRRVDTSRWRSAFEAVGLGMHDAADAFLGEFGGLTVDIGGPGVNRARTPFELDPELAWGEEDRFAEWSEVIGRHLYPIGELDHGRFFLGIDDLGVIWLVANWIAEFGPAPQAVESLVLGIAPRRIDQWDESRGNRPDGPFADRGPPDDDGSRP
ncbi:SUKH-3 domain-containing protein [Kitasatospora sp. NPDC096147]|uniref:SUKH-3 domain-containing protein n=1 Tax=Kitasatospora sp. NPDC096147 TaxID=3364093 RepID=UPI0037F4D404